MSGLVDVRSIIAGTLDDVERIAQSQGVFNGVLADLQGAQRLLWQRLHKEANRPGATSPTDRFTGARADATLEHCRIVTEYVQERIAGRTKAQAEAAIQASLKRTVTTLEGLEQRFRGVTPNLRLREAATLHATATKAGGLWARDFPTSVDRYGGHMLGEFENIIRAGIASGSTMDEMIGALTGHGGPKGTVSLRAKVTPNGVLRTQEADIPEGLFVRHKYWAERLVRTELLRAYSTARQAGLEEQAKQFPDMRRKILAILDKRTAKDSLAVHGQIRGIREHFVDGAGRSYLIPPARPNDRETVIPWRDSWNPSSANTSEYEKACMGEMDQAGEDALYERMKALTQGKKPRAPRKAKAPAGPQPPPGPPPLPPGLEKALKKLPPRFERAYNDDGYFPVDDAGYRIRPTTPTGTTKFKVKDDDLDELMKHGRVVKVDASVFRVVDAANAVKLPDVPPMQLPAKPTIAQQVEAKFRELVKVRPSAGSWGEVHVEGSEAAEVHKNVDGTFSITTRNFMGYRSGVGTFASPAEALAEARAMLYQRAAEAGSAFKEWSLDEFRDAVRAGDPTLARQMVRGLLWKEGVVPRDPFFNGIANANKMELKTDAEMPDARAWHAWTGNTAMRRTVWDESAGPPGDQERMLRTFVHEELHGSTRFKPAAYAGAGAAIEEVSVEMAARRIACRALGTDDNFQGIWGSYQWKIDEVRSKVADVFPSYGITVDQAKRQTAAVKDMIADAGIRMRSQLTHDEAADTPSKLIKQFVDALELPATLPPGYTDESMRRHLRTQLATLRAP